MAVITRLSWFWQRHADTRSVTSPVTRVRPLKIMHSRSSFTQSELSTLTQLSVPLQGRHRTYEDFQPATALHPALSYTQPPALSSDNHFALSSDNHSALSSDDHSTNPTNPALLTQHSRTRKQPDSHYRITAVIPYTVHLLSQVPADFVMHHHPSSLSLAGEYCRGTRDPSINMTHHTLTSCIS